MADNFNHSNLDITNKMICLSLHTQKTKSQDYMSSTKHLADYTEVFRAAGWPEKGSDITGRFSREIYMQNQVALGVENIRDQLSNSEK